MFDISLGHFCVNSDVNRSVSPICVMLTVVFRECARVVLDIKWQQLDEEEKCRQNFTSSLSSCHQLMAPRGFTRFGVLQELMDNPWTDPVLTMVMGSEEDNEEGEGQCHSGQVCGSVFAFELCHS